MCVHTYVLYCYDILLGVQQSIHLPISTAVTTDTQSLLSSDQHHHSLSSGKCITTLCLNVYVYTYITYECVLF